MERRALGTPVAYSDWRGDVAQWESASLARRRSGVQVPSSPFDKGEERWYNNLTNGIAREEIHMRKRT